MALDHWHSAVANRERYGLDVLTVGDSWGEGQGASTIANRWLDRLRDQLRTALTPSWIIPGGVGYVPAVYTVPGASQPWSYTGTTSTMSAFGLGRRCVKVAAGGTASLTFTGDAVDVYYAQGGYGASFTWRLDTGPGAPSGVVTQPIHTGTRAFNIDGHVLPIRGFWPPGVHTLTLEVSGAIPSTALYLGGAGVWSGDAPPGKGVRTWDGSHSGYDTQQMLASQPNWLAMLQRGHIRPDVSIIALGINDYGHKNTTAAAYGDRLGQLITHLRRHNRVTGSVIVCAMPQRSVVADAVEPWPAFRDAAFAAAAKHNAHLFDVGTVIPDYLSGHPLWADSVHVNDAGHALIADALAAELLTA